MLPQVSWPRLLLPAAGMLTIAILLSACSGPIPGGGGSGSLVTPGTYPGPVQGPASPLTAADVSIIVGQAAVSANNAPISIAVVDRVGNILGVWSRPDQSGNLTPSLMEEQAVAAARTGAFFSNDTAPLSSYLIFFLSREHFPFSVQNTPAADLFGIENTNRGCPIATADAPYVSSAQAVPPANNILSSNTYPLPVVPIAAGNGLGIRTNPGGFPLYKNNRLVGGIGVAGQPDLVNEYVSFVGTTNYTLSAAPPGEITLLGILLPYVTQDFTNRNGGPPISVMPGPGLDSGTFRTNIPGIMPAGTRDSPILTAPFAPEGYLIGPMAGTLITQAQVDAVVQNTIATAVQTRAAIRLPNGNKTRMCIAVAESVTGATTQRGAILALYRMPDATIFSLDVAVEKARNVVYFSDPAVDPRELPGVPPGIAVSNRTIGFGAQTMFPSGIDNSGAGPFRPLFNFDTANPCTQGQFDSAGTLFPNDHKSGVCFFPGSTILVQNGVTIAGFGVSGDGVAQDDFITNGGAVGYLPPPERRADSIVITNVRLPYFKFPRTPLQ